MVRPFLERIRGKSGVYVTTIAALSAPVLATAETAREGDAVILDPIMLFSEREDGPVSGYVAQSSSTAGKTGTPISRTAQTVHVIGLQEMEDRGAETVTDVLSYMPGVFATNGAASQRFDYFSQRGFSVGPTGTLLDGLRSTTQQSHIRYQPFGLERVETLQGPASVLYGANSPGGVMNAISKRPTSEPRREVGLSFGSFDKAEARLDVSGPLNADNTLRGRLVALRRDSGTQYDEVPDDTTYFAPSLTWAPSDDTSLTFLGSYSKDKIGPPRTFLPIQGTLLDNPNGDLARNTYLDGVGLENTNEQTNLGLEFNHRFTDVWSLEARARYTRNELMTQTLSGMSLAPDMRRLNRTAYEFGIDGDVFASDINLRADWGQGRVTGTSVIGLSYRKTEEDYYLNYGPAAGIDIYDPVHSAPFSATTPYASTDQTGEEIGLYAQSTITLDDRFVLDFGARQDWSDIDTDNRLAGTSTHQEDDAFTYRIGATWLAGNGLAPYASYSTSFQPVAGTDFYGNAYKPTEGKQAEIGIKYAPEGMDALFSAALYHLEQTNVQTTDPDQPLNRIQTGEVTSRGLELSASANISPAFRLTASYSANDLEVTSSTDPLARGNRPTGSPEHLASLWGRYEVQRGPLEGASLGAGLRYVGETYADASNTITVPDFTLVDLALSYDFGARNPRLDGVAFQVNVSNLFDKEYYSGCSARSCTEGFERRVSAALTYQW